MQMNSIVMALAGADRIFKLLTEEPEVDDGYVTLVRCKKENGEIVECKERTGMWAWKHYHKEDNTTTYKEMKGEVVFDGVDFGYNDDKIVLHDVKLYAKPGQKIAFVGSTGAEKQLLQTLLTDSMTYRMEKSDMMESILKNQKRWFKTFPWYCFTGYTFVYRNNYGKHQIR